MKRNGLLHGELSRIVAQLCPGERLALTGAAVPVPDGMPLVDLAVTHDVPRLIDVLDAVLAELRADRVLVAEDADPALTVLLQNRLAVEQMPDSALRAEAAAARAVVRCGETGPRLAVVLVCADWV